MKAILFLLISLFYFSFGFGQTINITHIDTELSSSDIEQIKKVYELERHYYYNVFDELNSNVDLKVYGDFKEFKHYQSLISKGSKSNSGFSSFIMKEAIVYKKKSYLNVTNHELSHLILQEAIPRCPKWLNEGLAEYFEYFQFKDNQYQLRLQYHKIDRVVNWLEEGKINLKKFLRQTKDSWNDNNKKPDFYSSSLSYSLILFLQEKEPEILKNILLESKEEKPILKSIKRLYPGGLEGLEADFKEYCYLRKESPTKVLKF